MKKILKENYPVLDASRCSTCGETLIESSIFIGALALNLKNGITTPYHCENNRCEFYWKLYTTKKGAK